MSSGRRWAGGRRAPVRVRKEAGHAKLVVGLGNPGRGYEGTRHNLGYLVARLVARELGLPRFRRTRYGLVTASPAPPGGGPGGLTLLLPTTLMNASGMAVSAALRGRDWDPRDLIVIHDDLDLPSGRLRLRLGGSTGGHRGLASIIGELGTDQFIRVKIGIGRPPEGLDPVDFVLEQPVGREAEVLAGAASLAAEAVLTLFREGLESAMNRFNRAPAEAVGEGGHPPGALSP